MRSACHFDRVARRACDTPASNNILFKIKFSMAMRCECKPCEQTPANKKRSRASMLVDILCAGRLNSLAPFASSPHRHQQSTSPGDGRLCLWIYRSFMCEVAHTKMEGLVQNYHKNQNNSHFGNRWCRPKKTRRRRIRKKKLMKI